MRSILTSIVLVLLCTTAVYAVPDTVYFTDNWKITDHNSYTYYRTIDVDNGDMIIMDHYQNGTVQMIGVVDYSEERMEFARTTVEMDGIGSGEYSWYNQNGTIYYTVNYSPSLECLDSTLCMRTDTSFLRLEKTYYMNGNVKEEGLMTSEGKPHGTCYEYHSNGKRSTETTYDNGRRTGTRYTYREDGVMIASTEYVDGRKNGEQKRFDDLGRLKEVRIYEDDKLIKRRKRYLSFSRR